MFQFTAFAPIARWLVFNQPGCPIQKSTDQFVFANPRSLSQLITSFFASKTQGILHAPLFTFFFCLLNVIKYLKARGMQLLLRIPKNSVFLNGFCPLLKIDLLFKKVYLLFTNSTLQ